MNGVHTIRLHKHQTSVQQRVRQWSKTSLDTLIFLNKASRGHFTRQTAVGFFHLLQLCRSYLKFLPISPQIDTLHQLSYFKSGCSLIWRNNFLLKLLQSVSGEIAKVTKKKCPVEDNLQEFITGKISSNLDHLFL